MGDSQILGTWTRLDRQLHNNCLELNAVIAALHHLVSVLQVHHILFATDNMTVVSFNKQGWTHSLTLLLVVDLFMWLQAQDIVLRARHIPGCLNVIADCLSRPNQPVSTEWSIHSDKFLTIFKFWGHVCQSPKYPPTSVHVSDSGASSTGGGCSVSGCRGDRCTCFR